jgi:hypothetical protein
LWPLVPHSCNTLLFRDEAPCPRLSGLPSYRQCPLRQLIVSRSALIMTRAMGEHEDLRGISVAPGPAPLYVALIRRHGGHPDQIATTCRTKSHSPHNGGSSPSRHYREAQ